MKYRYIKQSGQGSRYDVVASNGARIGIVHKKVYADKIVRFLNADALLVKDTSDANGCQCRECEKIKVYVHVTCM